MKYKILLSSIVFLLIAVTCYSQTQIKHGFKDVVLDSNRNSIAGLTYVNSHDGYDIYERKNQDLNLSDIELENVEYLFYKDKLAEIRVYFDSFRFNDIVDLFSSTYGQHSGLEGHMYSWGNSKTTITMIKRSGALYFKGKAIHPYFTIGSTETYINKSTNKTFNRAKDL